MTNIELDMEYISLYARQMNVSAIKAENDKVIFVDELLMYTALSYFLLYFLMHMIIVSKIRKGA